MRYHMIPDEVVRHQPVQLGKCNTLQNGGSEISTAESLSLSTIVSCLKSITTCQIPRGFSTPDPG